METLSEIRVVRAPAGAAPGIGFTIPVRDGFLVGRSPICHLRLHHVSIAPIHLRLRVTAGSRVIEQVADHFVTELRGERLCAGAHRSLHALHDRVRVGAYELAMQQRASAGELMAPPAKRSGTEFPFLVIASIGDLLVARLCGRTLAIRRDEARILLALADRPGMPVSMRRLCNVVSGAPGRGPTVASAGLRRLQSTLARAVGARPAVVERVAEIAAQLGMATMVDFNPVHRAELIAYQLVEATTSGDFVLNLPPAEVAVLRMGDDGICCVLSECTPRRSV